MAKWSANHKTITPTAVADTTNITDSTYPFALQGGSSTQKVQVSEVSLNGQAGASSPSIMVLGRHSTIGVTLTSDTNLTTQALDPATAALAAPVAVFNKATTKPQRSATLGGLLNLSFNAFGGIYRWVAPQGGEITLLGNTASFGELGLTCFTGGTPGLMGAHIVYEPF